MPTDPRIAVLSALSSPGWHPVPEAHGMPWDEAEQLLAAYDASRAAAASAVPSAPADRAATCACGRTPDPGICPVEHDGYKAGGHCTCAHPPVGRDESHRLAERRIREAARGLFFETGARVPAALDDDLSRVADEATQAALEWRHTCHDQKSAPGRDWECQYCSTLPESISVDIEPGKESTS